MSGAVWPSFKVTKTFRLGCFTLPTYLAPVHPTPQAFAEVSDAVVAQGWTRARPPTAHEKRPLGEWGLKQVGRQKPDMLVLQEQIRRCNMSSHTCILPLFYVLPGLQSVSYINPDPGWRHHCAAIGPRRVPPLTPAFSAPWLTSQPEPQSKSAERAKTG